jgi:hypothetical protein
MSLSKVRFHRKFRLLLQQLLKRFPPKSAKKKASLERQVINLMRTENRLLANEIRRAKPENRTWLQKDMDQAMNDLQVTLNLQNHIRKAPKQNRTWLQN